MTSETEGVKHEVRGEDREEVLMQREYTIRVPRPRRDPIIDFLAEFEKSLPPILPRLFKEEVRIRCPRCGSTLSVEVPEVIESRAFCSSCNALIRII